MSALFDKVSELFKLGKITEVGVENAVTKDWITEDQKNEILGIEAPTEETTEEVIEPETPVETPVEETP
mgnify:CR=1 FL=1